MSTRAAFTNVDVVAQILAKYVNSTYPQDPPARWDDIDTVVLDMDGTLLDLYFDTQVWNHALPRCFAAANGLGFDQACAEVAARLAQARGSLQWYCLDHWQERLDIDVGALEIEHAGLVRPRTGAIEFLQRLNALDVRLILATNAHPSGMQRKFELTGIDQYFNEVISSHDLGDCKESAKFWHALTIEYQIDPQRVLFVDDNHVVLDAARSFGIAQMFGIHRPDSRGEHKSSDDYYCLESFSELWAADAVT